MSRDAGQVHPRRVDLDEEEHVEPSEEDGVNGEEVRGQDGPCLGADEVSPGEIVPGPVRPQARTRRTVVAETLMPSPLSSPWMRTEPHLGSPWPGVGSTP